MLRIFITVVIVGLAYLHSSRSWSGDFDGAWEANVEIENWQGRISKFKATIVINENSFDSRVYDKNHRYSMIKGDISSSGRIQSGYFMWGNKSWSIPINQGSFSATSATLRGNMMENFLTIKLQRISNTSSKVRSLDKADNDKPAMERPTMIVGDTWIGMEEDWLSANYTKHITKIISVNKDGSFETLTEVPELDYLYHTKFDHKHNGIGSTEKNSETIIPEEFFSEGALNYPLWVGKIWKHLNVKGIHLASHTTYYYNNYYEVISYEKISVEAGEFWAFKVHWISENLGSTGGSLAVNVGEADFWISPKVKRYVKLETSWESKLELLEFIPGTVEASSTTKLDGNNSNDPAANDNSFKTKSKTETESSNDDPLEAKLEKLKKLLEKGLITEEEAAAKRAKLLEDM